MTTQDPSPAQAEALRDALIRGGLYRWPGGCWSPHPWDGGKHGPPSYATTNTVKALERRGWLAGDWKAKRLTDAGRELAERLDAEERRRLEAEQPSPAEPGE